MHTSVQSVFASPEVNVKVIFYAVCLFGCHLTHFIYFKNVLIALPSFPLPFPPDRLEHHACSRLPRTSTCLQPATLKEDKLAYRFCAAGLRLSTTPQPRRRQESSWIIELLCSAFLMRRRKDDGEDDSREDLPLLASSRKREKEKQRLPKRVCCISLAIIIAVVCVTVVLGLSERMYVTLPTTSVLL